MVASLEIIEKGYMRFLNNKTGKLLIFRVSDNLLRVKEIVEFDPSCGYIVFMGVFSHSDAPIEDYVDLEDILYDLGLRGSEEEYYSCLKKEDLCAISH